MSDERKPWTLAAAVALVMALVACTPTEEPRGPAAPPPTAPATTEASPTPSEDPYAMPDEIDEAYVQRVLEALGELEAEAVQELADAGRVTAKARELIAATRGDEATDGVIRTYSALLESEGADFFNADATAPVYSDIEVIDGSAACIFAKTTVDTRPLVSRPRVEAFQEYYWLSPKEGEDSPAEASNPTPWVIVGAREPRTDGQPYESPCAST